MSQEPKTVVLFSGVPEGDASFAAFGRLDQQLRGMENDNFIVIRADGPNGEPLGLKDVMQQVAAYAADGPVNVMIAAHGFPDGSMVWGDYNNPVGNDYGIRATYGSIFAELPKADPNNVLSVTVASCFGGSALDARTDLPDGTLLLPGSSDQSLLNLGSTTAALKELKGKGSIDSLTLYLELLDNFDPLINLEAEYNYVQTTQDVTRSFPDKLAIGGPDGKVIDLRAELEKRDAQIGMDAIQHVSKFVDDKMLVAAGGSVILGQTPSYDGSTNAYYRVTQDVNRVADLINSGNFVLEDLPPGDQRIALMLMAAQCEADGKFAETKQATLGGIGDSDRDYWVMPKIDLDRPSQPLVEDPEADARTAAFRKMMDNARLTEKGMRAPHINGDADNVIEPKGMVLDDNVDPQSFVTSDLSAAPPLSARDVAARFMRDALEKDGWKAPDSVAFTGINDEEPQGKNIALVERVDPNTLGKA